MSALLEWGGPILLWMAIAAGGRGLAGRLGVKAWGLGFLTGFSVFLILVYLASLAGAPIGLALFLINAGVTAACGILIGRGVPSNPRSHEPWTPAEWVLGAALGAVAVLALVKAAFFPVVAIDAHAYAGRALAMLHDRTLDIRLYHWPEPPSSNSNLSYPPLMSLAYAVSPAFGGWQHKIVNMFLALAWPLAVFETLRPRIPRFPALAWTLVLGLTPEIFAHISFDLLNLPAMALALGEAIALASYLESGDRKHVVLAGIFAAGMCGIRPDAVVIHGALWMALAIVAFLGRKVLRPHGLPLCVAFLAPAITLGSWALYMRSVLGLSPQGPLNAGHPMGLGPVLRALAYFPFWFEGFGITFYLFALALPWFGTRRRRERSGQYYLAAAIVAAMAIVILFSRIDQGYGGGPGAVLPFSFKRALFYLVPLSGLAAALSPWGRELAYRGSGWVHRRSPSQ
jgi:hypothetical protein